MKPETHPFKVKDTYHQTEEKTKMKSTPNIIVPVFIKCIKSLHAISDGTIFIYISGFIVELQAQKHYFLKMSKRSDAEEIW